jgi:hypothetical protein
LVAKRLKNQFALIAVAHFTTWVIGWGLSGYHCIVIPYEFVSLKRKEEASISWLDVVIGHFYS